MHDLAIVDIEPGDEVASAARIKELVAQTGIPSVALMVTAVPNEQALEDRLDEWERRFVMLKLALRDTPVQVGILIQALIGHGDRGRISGDVPFQKIVGSDGIACRESFCPLDRDFQAYTTQLITTLAHRMPAFFMIDDDFRIAYHDPARKGCMCPLHLKRFSQIIGKELSREELVAQLKHEGNLPLRQQWEDLKELSLVELAGVIRRAIDAVDPNIPGSFCCVAGEVHMAPAIVKMLSGQHQPKVRIHNAYYLENGHKDFPERVTRSFHEIAQFPAGTIILTEADTCPHNRHSLSVKSHLAHITATLLAGCHGAKYWFVKNDADGWEESAPYRKMLAQIGPFLRVVAQIRDKVTWLGPEVVGSIEEILRKSWDQQKNLDFLSDDWGWRVFGRMGIPFTITRGEGPAIAPRALCRTAPLAFDEDALLGLLSGPLLLDGEAAWHLSEMGLSQHLGVTSTRKSFACVAELLHVIPESHRTRELAVSMLNGGQYWLEPTAPETRVIASFASGSRGNYRKGTPALTWYQNALGGRIAVYGLSMQAPLDWVFYNNKRKTQLIETLTWLGQTSPVVVETDLDVFALYGKDNTNALVTYLCLFNLNLDTVDKVTFHLPDTPVQTIEWLTPLGQWEPVAFTVGNQHLCCDISVPTMEPVILRIHRCAGGKIV